MGILVISVVYIIGIYIQFSLYRAKERIKDDYIEALKEYIDILESNISDDIDSIKNNSNSND